MNFKTNIYRIHGHPTLITVLAALAKQVGDQSKGTLCQHAFTKGGRLTQTHLPNTHCPKFVSNLDTFVDALSQNVCSHETARERISCAIGIHDLFVAQLINRIRLRVIRVASCNNCSLGSTSEYNSSRSRSVRLGKLRKSAGDRREVGRVWKAICVCPRLGFRLIAKEDVDVRNNLLQLDFEELRDEWCR